MLDTTRGFRSGRRASPDRSMTEHTHLLSCDLCAAFVPGDRRAGAFPERWVVEAVGEWCTDAEICSLAACGAAAHGFCTTGAWARASWSRRADALLSEGGGFGFGFGEPSDSNLTPQFEQQQQPGAALRAAARWWPASRPSVGGGFGGARQALCSSAAREAARRRSASTDTLDLHLCMIEFRHRVDTRAVSKFRRIRFARNAQKTLSRSFHRTRISRRPL